MKRLRIVVLTGTAIATVAGVLMGLSGQASDTKGMKIFEDRCQGCHAGGGNPVQPNNPVANSFVLCSKECLRALLLNPPRPMPALPDLANDDAQLTALLEYCRTLKGPSGQASETSGMKIFEDRCQVCHVGGGNQAQPNNPVTNSFVLSSKECFKALLLKPPHPMPSMPDLANDDARLTALLEYCRTLK